MEKITTIQERHNLNDIYRLDGQGPGGACHEYAVVDAQAQFVLEHIEFQKGPRRDPESRSGVLDRDLLEIVRDRLKAFQSGPMACTENAMALASVEEALQWMTKRAYDRAERGVLGTMEK